MKKTVKGLLALSLLIGTSTASALEYNNSHPNINQQNNHLNQQDNNKKVWISIGNDAVTMINNSYSKQFNLTNIQPKQSVLNLTGPQTLTSHNHDINIVNIEESQLDNLSEFMHENFKRCGGYIFHESLAAAQQYTANIPLTQQVIANYTIDNPTGVNSLLNQLSSSNLTSTVNTLSNYNNRYYTSSTGVESANWLKSHWASISSQRSDINVELYNHTFQQSSVIATITGTSNSDEIVIIGGHLDSINLSNPNTGTAPGADDNASGIAVVTETLRAIVASGFKPKRTIKFIGYAAEEVGLRGSKAIAQDYKNQGLNIVGVAQFDMVGYKGTANKDIVFMTDYTNSGQNTFMTQLIDTYLSDISYGYDQCGYGCSDHASWHNQGYPASMPFESNMSDINSSIHTASDTSFNSAHALKFARLSATFAAELAKSGDVVIPPNDSVLENNTPRTVSGASKDEAMFTFEVPTDATSLSFTTQGGSGDADLYVRFGAEATTSTYDCKSTSATSTETCDISSIQTGTYHVMVLAWNQISNVNLTASYDTATIPPDDTNVLQNNVSKTDLSGARYENLEYTMVVPSGASNVKFTINGGSGDADLFIKFGSKPTSSDYDCRPYISGNNETCSANDNGGTYYIMINGYAAFSRLSLTGSYNPTISPINTRVNSITRSAVIAEQHNN
ncbi:MAG: M20/M25/M40 family metallo-hydrolase [Colwellia sp.]|nr:M20/M25/M40 family metallo-hydrolase [Colwellia sp.]